MLEGRAKHSSLCNAPERSSISLLAPFDLQPHRARQKLTTMRLDEVSQRDTYFSFKTLRIDKPNHKVTNIHA